MPTICQKSESTESLIPNNETDNEPNQIKEETSNQSGNEWMTFIAGKAKQLAESISKDMRDFDSTFNILLFGTIELDRSFLEQDLTKSAEWNNFVTLKGLRSVPETIKQSLLGNNEKLSVLHESCVPKVIDEEGFWNRWQFFCYLRDQQDKKKNEKISDSHSSESLNLLSEKKVLQLEEWE